MAFGANPEGEIHFTQYQSEHPSAVNVSIPVWKCSSCGSLVPEDSKESHDAHHQYIDDQDVAVQSMAQDIYDNFEPRIAALETDAHTH